LLGLFAALLVAALIAVPVLAIRSANPASEHAPVQAGDAETGAGDSDTDEQDEEGKGPPWAKKGDGPPFGNAWGHRRANDHDTAGDDDDNDGNGPPWARDGDGPPFGNAWGHWLNKGGDEACERIAARIQAHPGEGPPADIHDRITSELGCDLPR